MRRCELSFFPLLLKHNSIVKDQFFSIYIFVFRGKFLRKFASLKSVCPTNISEAR